MSIPLLSPVSATPQPGQLAGQQAKADHALVAASGQLAQQAIRKSGSDTVTISTRAVQMAKTTEATRDTPGSEQRITTPERGKQGR